MWQVYDVTDLRPIITTRWRWVARWICRKHPELHYCELGGSEELPAPEVYLVASR